MLNQPHMIFRLSILILILLSSTILTFGEERVFPQLLSFPIILISFYYVDQKKKLVMDSNTAALFGFLALLFGFLEFLVGSVEARLLSASHLVTYLMWISLFQVKDPRQYWWIIALSVMQVAIASVLTSDWLFGAGVFAYMFMVIWTLAFFSVYRATLRVQQAGQKQKNQAQQTATAELTSATPRKANLFSSVRGSIHLNPGELWISWQFFGGVIAITIMSLIVGSGFFMLTPRLWLGRVQYPSDAEDGSGSAIVGFSDKVQLGEMGQIMEKPEPVFSVTTTNTSDRTINIEDWFAQYGFSIPYFRGAVLSEYSSDGNNTQWKATSANIETAAFPVRTRTQLTRLEFNLESIGTNYLFTVGQFVNTQLVDNSISRISFNPLEFILRRDDHSTGKARYRIGIYPLKNIDGHMAIPINEATKGLNAYYNYESSLIKFPVHKVPRLIEYAEKLVEDETMKRTHEMGPREIAFFLESYLRYSPEFTYSLNRKSVDENVDPNEDFLLNSKSGHCEYYASSLTLMLRCFKIPSRIVCGFKGGTYDRKKQTFDVQQLHAHSWVEYYDTASSCWITLDPTPAGRDEMVATLIENGNTSEGLLSSIKSFWTGSIVNLNIDQQKSMFYEPAFLFLKKQWEDLHDQRMFVARIWNIVYDTFSNPDELFSLRGFIVVGSLGGGLALLWLVLTRLLPRVNLNYMPRRFTSQEEYHVPFYDRLLTLLQKLNLYREEPQTPLEFAHQASHHLTTNYTNQSPDQQFEALTNAYYHVRFGQFSLEPNESEHWENMVDQIEKSLQQRESIKTRG
jgi:transglutaminase-like putative cysteine protease